MFVEGVEVATEKYVRDNDTYRLEFNAPATPEITQQLARRVRHYFGQDDVWDYTDWFHVVFSNAVGQTEGLLPVRFVGVNDAPQLRLSIRQSAVVYPGSNLVVYTRRARASAEVDIFIESSFDPDGTSLRLHLTHAEDPEWWSRWNTSKTIRPGRHHFTLSTSDRETEVSQTLEFETMSVPLGLRQMKKAVREHVGDRRTRTKLIKLLTRAQVALAHRRPQVFYRRLYHFSTEPGAVGL